jgi:hypothetical protein
MTPAQRVQRRIAMSEESEQDNREAILSRAWARLDAYEAAHPEHPYATVLRLRVANPQIPSAELAELLAGGTGEPVSPEALRRLLEAARRMFAQALLDEQDGAG